MNANSKTGNVNTNKTEKYKLEYLKLIEKSRV